MAMNLKESPIQSQDYLEYPLSAPATAQLNTLQTLSRRPFSETFLRALLFDRDQADFQVLDIEERLKLYMPSKGLLRQEYTPDKGFDLKTSFNAFLDKPHVKTYTILGQGGSGKSLFTLTIFKDMLQSWQQYRTAGGAIPEWLPIYVPLKNYAGAQAERSVSLALEECGLDAQDIESLKTGMGCQQKVLFILDGYDELGSGIRPNLSQTLVNWPYAKILISGRPEHFENDQQHVAVFALHDAVGQPILHSYERYYVSPFSPQEIEAYVARYESTSQLEPV